MEKNIINPFCGVCYPLEALNPGLLWVKHISTAPSPPAMENDNHQKISQAERKPRKMPGPEKSYET